MVRDATADDAHAIAELHVRAWRSAYRGILAAQLLGELSVDLREQSWRSLLARDPQPGFTLAAEGEDGTVEGFLSAALPSEDEDAGERTAQITATYVDPARWGEGVGRSMMEVALQRLLDEGWGAVTAWVFLRNAQGRAFFARAGFRLDGVRGTHATSGVTTTRMRLTLA